MTLSKWMILYGESQTQMCSAQEMMRRVLVACREEKNG